ncbi:hypothetical protein JS530_05535 [Bifidobacterium sp. LC6]|uniref:Uncharacterized protein n=1 Tax=Bifidobacterium colobi TaxID=2809026 RepID=A0ABS5UV73_9BIFI|nr:hypothetical protein [Bifidobacterium colobi]MBT1174967.1 hypothetical protein [Bifidobacterium colobi]
MPPINTVHLIGLENDQAVKAFAILRDAYQGMEDAQVAIDEAEKLRSKLTHVRIAVRVALICSIICAIAAGITLWAILNYQLPSMWQIAWSVAGVSAVLFIANIVALLRFRSCFAALRTAEQEAAEARDMQQGIEEAIAPLERRLPEKLRNPAYVIRVLKQSDSASSFGDAMVKADLRNDFAGRKHAYQEAKPLPITLDEIATAIGMDVPDEQQSSADEAPADAQSTDTGDADAAGTSAVVSNPQETTQDSNEATASTAEQLPAEAATIPSKQPSWAPFIVSMIASLAAVAISIATLAWAAPMRQREIDEWNAASAYCSEQYQRLVKARSNADDALGKVAQDTDDAHVDELRALADKVGKESCAATSTDQLRTTAAQYQAQVKTMTSVLAEVNKTVQAQQSDTQKQLDLYSNFKQLWDGLSMGNPTNGSDALDGTYCRKDGACLQVAHAPTDYVYGTVKYAGGGSNPLFDAGPLELDFNYQAETLLPSVIKSIYLKAGLHDEMCGSMMQSDCTEQHLYYAPAGMDLMAVAGQGANSTDVLLRGFNIDSSDLPDSSKAYLIVGSVNSIRELEDGVYGSDSDYDSYGTNPVSDATVFYKQ